MTQFSHLAQSIFWMLGAMISFTLMAVSGRELFSSLDKLTLRKVKKREFPCLDICMESIKIGKNAPTIVNAANEVAVEHFLNHSVKFTDIPIIIKAILDRSRFVRLKNIDDVIECNKETRKRTTKLIESKWK